MKGVVRQVGVWAIAACVSIAGIGLLLPLSAQAQTLTPEERARLQAEYDAIQKEIAEWQKVLDETRNKKSTLQGDVTALNAQINKAQAEINHRNLTIGQLAGEINQRTSRLADLETRLENGRETLAKLLREKHQAQSASLAVLVLSSKDLSQFFSSVDGVDAINRELQGHLETLRDLGAQTQKEKEQLDQRRSQELDARYEVQVKQNQINQNKKEVNSLLSVTAQEEQAYQKVLAERRQRAETIRSALFELRDAQGIPFSTALAYATEAEQATGVRAAFILGILRQESNLGVNVGQCLLVDPDTGMGKGKNTGTPFKNTMHPTRDVPPFLDITQKLGRDPYNTVVSCPQSIGYGGAMGPSQFIASTWKIYASRLAAKLGVATADPWIPGHAIMATALFLEDLGADKKTYSAEQEAAGRYYAGGNWRSLGLGYASSVLSFASKYQEDIDFLKSI